MHKTIYFFSGVFKFIFRSSPAAAIVFSTIYGNPNPGLAAVAIIYFFMYILQIARTQKVEDRADKILFSTFDVIRKNNLTVRTPGDSDNEKTT